MRKSLVYSAALVLAFAAQENLSATTDDATWLQQLKQWRTDRAAGLRAPDSWLSLVGLEWLKPGENTFGTSADSRVRFHAPGNEQFGVIDVEPDGLRLKAPKGGFPHSLLVDGHPAAEQAVVLEGRNPTQFTDGTLSFFVIRRGELIGFRIRDSHAPTLINFHDLNWYAPSPQYRIEADWVPYPEPKHEVVVDVVGQRSNGLVLGIAKFHIDGQEVGLEPVVQNENAKNLMFVLRDATSGKTTYAASRFLHTGLPDHGLRQPGKIVLDFNRLENPPCAYTPYATCPLPTQQNRLKVTLAAGEQKYSNEDEAKLSR